MTPDEILQAYRLSNPGELHRQVQILYFSDPEFVRKLGELLKKCQRKPSSHAVKS